MSNIKIKEVTLADCEDFRIFEMLQSIGRKENGFGNSAFGISKDDYPGYIEKLVRQKTLKGNEFVPQTVFWLFDDNTVIGFSKMRHYLNDKLRIEGGHIGFGIRKEKRNQGYGKILLKLTLSEMKKIGVSDVLLTCDSDNIGSINVIEANNGKLEKEENDCRWYWIKI